MSGTSWPAMLVVVTLAVACAGCSRGVREADDTGAASADTATAGETRSDTLLTSAPVDTPPTGAGAPSAPTTGGAPKVSQAEYEGWRQYSVNCARCHGQDVLPNPVAANLLVSLAAGGPVESEQKFTEVVSEGRPERGMPAFKGIMSPEQIRAVYAYAKGRADKRIPAGRPTRPSG